jgi:LysR family transcriptional regulator, regulator for bpeEF and oprC
MDRFVAMAVFAQVVDSGGFTRAAEALRMPKATVTTLVQNLEAHLGVKLLNRTTRRVEVTPDGAAYYERCTRILAEVQETESALSTARASPQGRLRVDVSVAFGRRVLMPALPEFLERYPGIRIEVGCTDRVVDLLEEGVDCVVRAGEPAESALVARRLGLLDFICCAAPSYLARCGVPEHPRDLVQHRVVNFFSPRTGKIMPWDFTRGGERIEIMLDGPVATNDSEAYLAAGLAGLGVVQLTRGMVSEHLAQGRFTQVLAGWTIDPLPIYAMYPRNRHLSAKVRVFVEWVAELIAARQRELLLPSES